MNARLYQLNEWLRKDLEMSKKGIPEVPMEELKPLTKKKKKVNIIGKVWGIMNNGIK